MSSNGENILDRATARGLGLLSLGIGMTEVAAPDKVQDLMGLPRGTGTGVLRILGVRELLHGLDLLTHRQARAGVRGRVMGDVLDTVALGMAATRTRNLKSFGIVAGLVMGIGLADLLFAKRLKRKSRA